MHASITSWNYAPLALLDELPDYLSHRLRLAGCKLPLFEPAAIEAIFQATQGVTSFEIRGTSSHDQAWVPDGAHGRS